tara:strand:- start:581 stop:847 length:267 start_codon:yes stop_codon:yes gene_type:complete
MTIKEAKRVKPGAVVRESWSTNDNAVHGIVLDTKFEVSTKMEHQLCQTKESRYIMTVAWFKLRPNAHNGRDMVTKSSSYSLMLVSRPA